MGYLLPTKVTNPAFFRKSPTDSEGPLLPRRTSLSEKEGPFFEKAGRYFEKQGPRNVFLPVHIGLRRKKRLKKVSFFVF